MALNNRQQVFVSEYLKCWNSSEAARRAGYNGRSDVVGPRLLVNVGIQAEIQAKLAELAMSADEVLKRFGDEGRASVAMFLKPNSIELDPLKVHEYGHLIKSLSHTTNGPKIELYDSQAARLNIGKQLGLFTDKHLVELKLQNEVDALLDILKETLPQEQYASVLHRLSGEGAGKTTATESVE